MGGGKPYRREMLGRSGRIIRPSAKFSNKRPAGLFSKRLLLVSAFLAGEFHAAHALFRRDAIWRAALSAGRLDAGVALLHHNGLAFHGFADQALGLFAHRLLRHPLIPVMKTAQGAALYLLHDTLWH